jgi:DnaJ domain
MFGSENEKRIPVTLTLADGQLLIGSLASGPAASLATELNREGLFLAVRDTVGKNLFLAKAAITRVVEGDGTKDIRMPTTPDGRNPFKVLRLPDNATPEMIRQAYIALARQYHPDHYGEATAPEVREYVTAMFQQITAAHQALKTLVSDAA